MTVSITEQEDYMLTTTDNPWNPWDNYDEWDVYDQTMGYHTSAFLARVMAFSFDLSEPDQDRAITEAIDEIVRENVLGIYIKITKNGTRKM